MDKDFGNQSVRKTIIISATWRKKISIVAEKLTILPILWKLKIKKKFQGKKATEFVALWKERKQLH